MGLHRFDYDDGFYDLIDLVQSWLCRFLEDGMLHSASGVL